jgi:lysophospholipase L1-like esterase
MERKPATDYRGCLTEHGRTFWHDDGTLYLNWTCSGVSFSFTGTTLLAEMTAVPGAELEMGRPMPFAPAAPTERKTWPCVAVFLDDGEQPSRYFELDSPQAEYLVFAAKQPETHKITIRKMTENPKGKAGLIALRAEGCLAPAPVAPKKLKLEFIGDSITCGFGNATQERDRMFYPLEENGWLAHPAVAARILDADFSTICYSGIAVMKWGMRLGDRVMPAMGDLYPYTDRLIEEMQGKTDEFQPWHFAANRPDVIILNLGTNDASIIDFTNQGAAGRQLFEEEYIAFLRLLREKNGPEPWIVCALGSMDYFLYDNIRQAASRFEGETGDSRIRCFKYGRMRFIDGFGGAGHPNTVTHQRMGQEIADFIRPLVGR